MEIAMIINILPQTKANVVVASVEDKLKILASCNVVEDTYCWVTRVSEVPH